MDNSTLPLYAVDSEQRNRQIFGLKIEEFKEAYPDFDTNILLANGIREYADDVWEKGYLSIVDAYILQNNGDLTGLDVENNELDKTVIVDLLRDLGWYTIHTIDVAKRNWITLIEK